MGKTAVKTRGLGERIAAARKRAELTQTALGKAIGTTRSAVSQWESDSTEPTPENLRVIAMRTGFAYEWLATGRGAPTPDDDENDASTVPVRGYVGAGATAHYLPQEVELDRVEAPPGATEATIALEIRGTSLGELFDRWLVFVDDVRTPVTPDLIGKTCVVGLQDGRVLVKKLKKAAGGLYDLLSNTEDPIRAVAVEWAAKVKHMGPR